MSDADRSANVAALEVVCDFVEGLIPAMPTRSERAVWLEAVLRLRRLKCELATPPAGGGPRWHTN